MYCPGPGSLTLLRVCQICILKAIPRPMKIQTLGFNPGIYAVLRTFGGEGVLKEPSSDRHCSDKHTTPQMRVLIQF